MSKEKFYEIVTIGFPLLFILFGLYIMITNLGDLYSLRGVSGCFLFSGGLNLGFIKIVLEQQEEIKKLKEKQNE